MNDNLIPIIRRFQHNFIPGSAIIKILNGELIPNKLSSLLYKNNLDLILEEVDLISQEFKDKYFMTISDEEFKRMRKKSAITEEERDLLIKRMKGE